MGHDPRLTSLYHDLNLYQDYFISHDAPNIWEDIQEKVRLLLGNNNLQKDVLKKGFQEQLSLSQKNRIILGKFLQTKGMLML